MDDCLHHKQKLSSGYTVNMLCSVEGLTVTGYDPLPFFHLLGENGAKAHITDICVQDEW